MDDAIGRAEKTLDEVMGTNDHKMIERAKAWSLRLKGYSVLDISEELQISYGTAQADVRWCLDNLPAAYESAEDFRRITLPQLDAQYRALISPRKVIDDNGQEREVAPPESAFKVAMMVKDMQSKLLGAYLPVKVDANITTVAYTVDGVNTEEV